MADPDEKISVALGDAFILRWTADRMAPVTNTIDVIDDKGTITSKQFVSKFLCTKSAIEFKVHVTRDGQPYGFRTKMKPPRDDTSPDKKQWIFTSLFVAHEEVTYLFTIEASNGATHTKEVTIGPATLTLNDKRAYLMDIVSRWMPSSVKSPRPPQSAPDDELLRVGIAPGTTIPDLLKLAGWNAATVAKSKADALANKPTTTSCGSVLGKVLKLWKCDFDNDGNLATREMGIADDAYVTSDGVASSFPRSNATLYKGARTYHYYQDAGEAFTRSPQDDPATWAPLLPTPGDIVVLRDGPSPSDRGIGHVGVVVSATTEVWVTADGGGGSVLNDDQIAEKSNRVVSYTAPDATHPMGRPILVSVTDGNQKLVDGWARLDDIPNDLFDSGGSRK